MVVGVWRRHLVHVKLGLPAEDDGIECRLLASVIAAGLRDEVEVGRERVVLRAKTIVRRERHRGKFHQWFLLRHVAGLLDAVLHAVVVARELVAVVEEHVAAKHLNRRTDKQVLPSRQKSVSGKN